MNRNTWRARATMLAALIVLSAAHWTMTSGVENTPFGMFMYHGSAASVDLLLLVISSRILQGGLSVAMQVLCAVSMAVNFLGWIAYLLYISPIYYDSMIWVLNAIQFVALFFGGIYDAHRHGVRVVHSSDSGGTKFYLGKKNQ